MTPDDYARSRTPFDEEILYHYCSNATLHAILFAMPRPKLGWLDGKWSAQTIPSVRLSSMGLANDSMEGKLLFDAILARARAASACDVDMLRAKMHAAIDEAAGLAFCLSQQGDLLSQWRGYADDGHGVAVGFRAGYLKQLAGLYDPGPTATQLFRAIYSPEQHREAEDHAYRFLIDRCKDGNEIEAKRLVIQFLALGFYCLKGAAFAEEKEVRLLTVVPMKIAERCNYHVLRNRIVPFLTLPLLPIEGVPQIKRVILGPKNQTPTLVVEAMFKKAGIEGVEVQRSAATYHR